MGRFWDDLFPSALVTTVLFVLGIAVILSTLKWIPYFLTYEAMIILGLWFCISCILGGIFLGTAVDDGLLHSTIKFASLVALLNSGVLLSLLSMAGWYTSLSLINELGRGIIWLIISAFAGTSIGSVIGWFISQEIKKRRMKEVADPLAALKMRLSKGEISIEEYKKLKKQIEESQ